MYAVVTGLMARKQPPSPPQAFVLSGLSGKHDSVEWLVQLLVLVSQPVVLLFHPIVLLCHPIFVHGRSESQLELQAEGLQLGVKKLQASAFKCLFQMHMSSKASLQHCYMQMQSVRLRCKKPCLYVQWVYCACYSDKPRYAY